MFLRNKAIAFWKRLSLVRELSSDRNQALLEGGSEELSSDKEQGIFASKQFAHSINLLQGVIM